MSIPLPRTQKPMPKTTSAVLFCEEEKKFTLHTYHHADDVMADSGHRSQTKFIFSCACGSNRVWGSED